MTDSILSTIGDALGDAPLRVQPLGQTLSASVYRIWTSRPPRGDDGTYSNERAMAENDGRRTWIIKLVKQPSSANREVETYRHIVVKLPIQSPRVIGHGVNEGAAWMTYTDDGLIPVFRTTHRYHQALATMAALHRTPVARNWPRSAASHTPPFEVVRKQVSSMARHQYDESLRGHDFSATVVRAVREMLDACQTAQMHPLFTEPAICHGDAHLGNWMWSTFRRTIYLIDWEYVHIDSPYFDLFQLLDVTSPTTTITRAVSRWSALKTYYLAWTQSDNHDGGTPGAMTWRLFAAGYVTYAATYLLWIIGLIEQDVAHRRFHDVQMRRQLAETVFGLVQLNRGRIQLGLNT